LTSRDVRAGGQPAMVSTLILRSPIAGMMHGTHQIPHMF
jgi:hypothetical protein